ncbi:MAG: integrase core domain-containing protein [Bdellovibrionales bacterium]
MDRCCKIAVNGGPGGGKTTATDLYRREIGDDVILVPEAATILYLGGFPRAGEVDVPRATPRAMYHVQLNLEDARTKIDDWHWRYNNINPHSALRMKSPIEFAKQREVILAG